MPKKEIKTKSKIMRMTEQEAQELDDLLSKTDLNFSQLVRKSITDLKNELDENKGYVHNKVKTMVKPSKVDREVLLELGRVGNNINQIAKSLNILKKQNNEVEYFQCLLVLKEMRTDLQNVVVQLPKKNKNDD